MYSSSPCPTDSQSLGGSIFPEHELNPAQNSIPQKFLNTHTKKKRKKEKKEGRTVEGRKGGWTLGIKGKKEGINLHYPEISKMMLCLGEEFVDWGMIMRKKRGQLSLGDFYSYAYMLFFSSCVCL